MENSGECDPLVSQMSNLRSYAVPQHTDSLDSQTDQYMHAISQSHGGLNPQQAALPGAIPGGQAGTRSAFHLLNPLAEVPQNTNSLASRGSTGYPQKYVKPDKLSGSLPEKVGRDR